MGCDIHLYLEVFVGEEWFPLCVEETPHTSYDYQGWYQGRNYELFGALAGVRGVQKGLDPPRGLPIDASSLVRKAYDAWGMDAHSATWFTVEELFDCTDWPGDCWEDLERCLTDRIMPLGEASKLRLIMWFDN